MMTRSLEIMTDGELERACHPDDDACFGTLSTARGHLPLEAMDVRARVVGLVSNIELRQTFVNTLDEAIEATYVFPLPDRAAVTSFRMEVNGRVVEGLIKERGQARQEYDQAIAAGHRAAITEEERPGVFTMRVGNLVAGDRAVVRLTMTGPIPIEEGDATFRFPLVVAPRYMPGVPLAGENVGDGVAQDTDAVPDASRISPPVLLPGYPNPVRLSMQLEIDPAGVPLSNLRSSLHSVVEGSAGGARTVALRPGERLNRDFIVRFSLGDEAVRTSLVLARDAEGDGGTFLLTMVPPTTASAASKPRDVVFVLDRSGSMGGWKMVAARRAVARMVDSLNDEDRFTVLAFDNVIDVPSGIGGRDLVAATDRNRFRAVEFLANLSARGGTEMAGPLELAADQLSGGYGERERILVLATDGQVGNEAQILRRLKKRLKNVRVFTLGIDRAVNAAFLKRLASMGAGAFELVESEDRLDEVMDKIHRRIGTPVVTELSLEPTGLELVRDSIAPARLPDLFAGSPVTISGRFRGPASGAIALRGQASGGDTFGETITGRAETSRSAADAVAKMWARGHIRDLEDRYVSGERGDLERRITDTSLRFSVLCKFTAFLAVDDAEKVDSDGDPRRVMQPVDAPDGWAMFGAGAAAPAMPGGMPQPVACVPAGAAMKTMMGGAPSGGLRGGPGGAAGGPPPPVPQAPDMRYSAAAPAPGSQKRAGGVLGAVAGGVGAILGAPIEAAKALGRAGKKRKGTSTGAPVADLSVEELDEGGESTDWTAYRDRLVATRDDISACLRDAAGGDPRTRLRRLIDTLDALREDLASIGGPGAVVRALADLVTELRARLGRAGTDGECRDALRWSVTQLDGLVDGGPSAQKAPARAEFWK